MHALRRTCSARTDGEAGVERGIGQHAACNIRRAPFSAQRREHSILNRTCPAVHSDRSDRSPCSAPWRRRAQAHGVALGALRLALYRLRTWRPQTSASSRIWSSRASRCTCCRCRCAVLCPSAARVCLKRTVKSLVGSSVLSAGPPTSANLTPFAARLCHSAVSPRKPCCAHRWMQSKAKQCIPHVHSMPYGAISKCATAPSDDRLAAVPPRCGVLT